MDEAALARLVETSEAEAYRTLARAAATENEEFVAQEVGGGIAIVSSSITTTLNLNRVIGLGVHEPATLEQLDEIERLYGARGLSFGIEVGPFVQPRELVDWLRARKIRRGIETAMLYRALDEAPEPPSSIQVRLADPSEASVVSDICCDSFRMPSAARKLFAGIRSSSRWRQWLAFVGTTPAGAALSYIGETAAWLGWDATIPDFRGRGVHAALIARRLEDARDSGCGFATSETAVGAGERRDPSLKNYERAGFTLAYERSTYIRLNRGARASA